MDIYRQLEKVLTKESVKRNELLSRHTTLKIGGPADYLVTPALVSDIKKVIEICRENNVPFFVMGRGSNILAGDRGYRGVVIKLSKEFADFSIINENSINENSAYGNSIKENSAKRDLKNEEPTVSLWAQSGIALSKLANEAAKAGLTGLECESGIPGSLGGAIAMNAGAYGGEIKDYLDWVELLTPSLDIVKKPAAHMDMGYRNSYVIKNPGNIVLSAHFTLKKGNSEEIYKKMEELNQKRKEKQPLEYPSAGSTFKRPQGYFAGRLIEDCGLKGYSVGDMEVSKKHCGFVINKGKGTANEMKKLMEDVDRIVFEKNGVHLEPEVRLMGEF